MAATSGSSGDPASAYALLWEERSAPKRGPKPTLTLATIIRTGIEIADTDGLAAVTMQRVADTVGVTKMALYRYVPGKVELVALMTEDALGEPPRLDTMDGWREKLDAWARRMFEAFSRHPWVLRTTLGNRPMGPNELGWTEQAAAALTGTGLHGGEILDVTATVVGHVRMVAEQVAAFATDTPEQSLDFALAELAMQRRDRFPALAAALESAVEHTAQDKALEFGLARILDGVRLYLGRE